MSILGIDDLSMKYYQNLIKQYDLILQILIPRVHIKSAGRRKHMIIVLIVCLGISSHWRIVHSYGDVTIPVKS